MSPNPGYIPPLDSASTLVIALGYVNLAAAVTGIDITLGAAGGALFLPSDVGGQIQVSGNNAATPPVWESWWTTITGVTSSTAATLADGPPSFALTGAQAIIYRPIGGDTSPGTDAPPSFSWTERQAGHVYDGVATWDSPAPAAGAYAATIPGRDTDAYMSLVALKTVSGSAAYIQGANSESTAAYSAATIALAFASANTAGNCLVAQVLWSAGPVGDPFPSITDSLGNSWTLACSQSGAYPSGQRNAVFVAPNCAAGANTVTLTIGSGTFGDYAIALSEYSGIVAASPVDAFDQTEQQDIGPDTQTVTVSTSVPGDILLLSYFTHQWITDPAVLAFAWPPAAFYYILQGSIDFEYSLTTAATLNFDVFTANGSFIPQVGQPVLMWDTALATNPFGGQIGDLFGGSIEQVEVSNIAGTPSYICKCDCRSWSQIFTRRILGLVPAIFPTLSTTIDFNGGQIAGTPSKPAWSPFYGNQRFLQFADTPPLAILSMTISFAGGAPVNQTIGTYADRPPAGHGGFDWYWTTTGYQVFEDSSGPTLTDADAVVFTVQLINPQTPSVSFASVTADAIAWGGASVEGLVQFIAGEEGITAANIVTGPPVNAISFTADTTFDDALSSLLTYINDGTQDFWYYLDPRKGFHFEIVAATAAPFDISESDASDGNVLVAVSNATTREKYANAAYSIAASFLAEMTQSFIGNSTTSSFSLAYPCGTAPKILFYPANSGTPPTICPPVGTEVPGGNHVQTQTVGVQGQAEEANWYWSPGSTEITQGPPGPDITDTAAIYVTYTPQIGLQSTYAETAAIAARQAVEGGSGEYDVSVDVSSDLPFVQGVPAQGSGGAIAQTIAQYFSYMAQTVTVKTYRTGLAPAMAININLGQVANPGILPPSANGLYVIQSVKMSDKGNLQLWEVTAIAGALIGDWKTAVKYMTGGGSGGGDSIGAAATTPKGLTLEVDGTPNVIQTELNLVAGAGVTIVDDGAGDVTISATAAISFAREAPAGTLNGTNVTFTLSNTPNPPESLLLTLNGVEQSPGFGSPATGADYSISGATITFTVAPIASDWMMAFYTY